MTDLTSLFKTLPFSDIITFHSEVPAASSTEVNGSAGGLT